jgi:hypothetical protein
MSNQIERLPQLIKEAIAALSSATSAAEILEAKDKATVVYEAAKLSARLAKFKNAHDTVVAACRKTQADALVIETRAQCRLADEYDAAQKRGEVAQHGGKRGNQYASVPKENLGTSTTDIGLTRKQVHEARQIRDIEKADPGAIRAMLDQQLKDGKEPTRAAIKRATRTNSRKTKRKPAPRPKITDPHKDQIVAMAASGRSHAEIGNTLGLHERVIGRLLQDEDIRRNAEAQIDPATLSLTAQQKLEMAIRQHKHKLDLAFEIRVRDEVKKRIDEIVLPHWKEKIEHAEKLYSRRKGLMDKATFNKIRRGLHPDSRNSISDKMLGEAFDAFMALEKFLLDEKESPTDFSGLPKSWAEWEKAKQTTSAERRARYAKGHLSALRRT